MTLTVRDEWTLTNTSAPQSVTIVEPAGNSAPVPTFAQSCTGPDLLGQQPGHGRPQRWGPANTPDTITYSWNWGDGTALSTGASPAAHVYAATGSYTITLTTTDGWGKSASTTRDVTLIEPAANTAPNATFTATCPPFTTCQMNSAGTADAEVTRSGTRGTGAMQRRHGTTASPSHTYATPGTYTIVLTVTDVWGKVGTATQEVTMTEPESNGAPIAVIE